MTKEELVNAIKVCLKKSDDHWTTAGQYLKQLYRSCKEDGSGQKEFLRLTKKEIGIGKSRTYEILAIADGTKTIEEIRAATAKRTRETRRTKAEEDVRYVADISQDRKEAFPTRVMVDLGEGGMRPATPEEEETTFAVAASLLNPIIHAWEMATQEQRLTFARQYFNDVRRFMEGQHAHQDQEDEEGNEVAAT